MRILALPMFLLASSLAGAEGVSLSSALVRLEGGNHALEAAQAKVTTSEQVHRASYGNFLPVVKLEANAVHIDREIDMDFTAMREAMIGSADGAAYAGAYASTYASVYQSTYNAALASGNYTSTTAASYAAATAAAYGAQVGNGAKSSLNPQLEAGLPPDAFVQRMKAQNDWGLQLVAYQPIFHGGKILAAERIASARERAAGADLDKQRNDLRRDFVRLYVQGVLLRQSIALRTEAISSIERHRDQARKAFEQGMADRAALLRAEMALADARTSLADDSMRLQSVALTLGQMAGSSEPLLPTDTLRPPPSLPGSPDSLASSVERRNPLLRSLSAQQDVARKAVAVREADLLPEVGLFGTYEFNREGAREALQPIWIVGLKAEFTLFRGMGDWRQREAALSTEREVAAMRAEASTALSAQVRRQVLAVDQARLRFENLRAQASLARENHRVTEARFAQGQATGLEVVDAWLAQQKADLDRLSAAGDGWIALGEVLWASGRTDEFAGMWMGGSR